MTANAPSSSASRRRGTFSTAPAAIRRKHASITGTASPAVIRPSTSASVR